MIVCHCFGITDKNILQLISEGMGLAEIAEATSATTDCGTCLETIKKLLDRYSDEPTDLSQK